jgi:hypothetical protein
LQSLAPASAFALIRALLGWCINFMLTLLWQHPEPTPTIFAQGVLQQPDRPLFSLSWYLLRCQFTSAPSLALPGASTPWA